MEARRNRTETQLEMAFQALWPTLEGKLATVVEDDDDPGSDDVDDQNGLPTSTKRLTLLVESLSARILSWEERAFGARDSLRQSGFSAPEMLSELRQEIAKAYRRLADVQRAISILDAIISDTARPAAVGLGVEEEHPRTAARFTLRPSG